MKISRFTAAYDSDCEADLAPDCPGQICCGDYAGYIDDEVACETCCDWQGDEG